MSKDELIARLDLVRNYFAAKANNAPSLGDKEHYSMIAELAAILIDGMGVAPSAPPSPPAS